MNFTLDALMDKLLTLPGIVLGLSMHEFAHAWMSNKLGDPTPGRQGRLTLNPLAHIDWIGFVMLIIIGFGWGRPVQIDPSYYKNKRRDEFLVGIAGVTMNLILAVIFSIPVRFMRNYFMNESGASAMLLQNVFLILLYAVMLNLVLMIFNLIPCPPLDGFGILTQIFKLDKYDWWYPLYQKGTLILLVLIVTRMTGRIITPMVSILMDLLVYR